MTKFVFERIVLVFVCLAAAFSVGAQLPNAAEDCGCETAPLPDILLILDKTPFKQTDLFPNHVVSQVRTLQQEVIDARRRELDLIVNSRLLAAEAKKRRVSTKRLLEDEVIKKTVDPTEVEAQAFYEKNKVQIGIREFASVKDQIVERLCGEKQQAVASAFAQRLRAAADVKMLVEFATAPKTAADRSRILATVNGEPIRSADVEDNLRALIFATQEQVYAVRKLQIDQKINDTLLDQEAKKRGITAKAVLDEVGSKVTPVTESDAQAFYNENKARLTGEFVKLKAQIIRYLDERRKNEAQAAFAETLRKAAVFELLLPQPVPPTYKIDIAGRPIKGSQAAPVTVVEFINLQCNTCAVTQGLLYRLVDEYKGRVKLVALHFPLSQHEHAARAAEAVEAAGEQGKLWEYMDLLLNNQSALSVDDLKKHAGTLGLDRRKFDAALDSGRFEELVQKHIAEGAKTGVTATPFLFVNGVRASGSSYEALKAAIEEALKKSAP